MRVLMLAPQAPYPASYGAALRNLHLLRWLSRHHEVTLVAFGESQGVGAVDMLRTYARDVRLVPLPRRSLRDRLWDVAFTTQPDLARRLSSGAMIEAIRDTLCTTRYDVVQIEGLEMYPSWREAERSLRTPPRVILDEHNAEYALQASVAAASWRRGSWIGGAYSSIQALRLRRFERNAVEAVDGVIAVSQDDARWIAALATERRIAVIPNGVDLLDFVPSQSSRRGMNALFIGKMDYRPNVDAVEWLCSEIWLRVREACPRATLEIVGRDPLPQVRRLGRMPGVEVVGDVVDERPWFQESAVLVVPMRMGSGVRLKVLQAMATSTPIVSTRLGMSGIGAVAETHFLLAESASDFAGQVVRALSDRELRIRLAKAALDLVRSRFDWQVILPRLDQLLQEVAGDV